MPPLPPYIPFPSPMRIGTDICQIDRILSILQGRHASVFVRKILRKEEIDEMGKQGMDRVIAQWNTFSGRKSKDLMDTDWKTATRTSDWKEMCKPPVLSCDSPSAAVPQRAEMIQSMVARHHDYDEDHDQNADEDAKLGKVWPKQNAEEIEREMERADRALRVAARWLAGRFAAKEATMKAYTSRRLTYHSILILKPPPKEGVEGSVAPVAIVLDEEELRREAEEQKSEKKEREAKKEEMKEREKQRKLEKENEKEKEGLRENEIEKTAKKVLGKEAQLKEWVKELEARERRERIDRERGHLVLRMGTFRKEGDRDWLRNKDRDESADEERKATVEGEKEDEKSVSKTMKKKREMEKGIVGREVRISISHDGQYATAVCLAVDE
ncbi:uncharacterized protein RSE6_01937 [Rhynchosporium secalis]|uniref:4'-phosphopantetheinyl transferase domain-containing protein n=1 Tax=Rhynchosporium secalis TaxID=38038 RepID=A0A1E1LZ19_RHYSE|nr:uncharacterized protein RSE6_01937 [Rhynchosporium secalis]